MADTEDDRRTLAENTATTTTMSAIVDVQQRDGAMVLTVTAGHLTIQGFGSAVVLRAGDTYALEPPRRRAPKIPTHTVRTRNPGAIQ